jgi:hypothetical protein
MLGPESRSWLCWHLTASKRIDEWVPVWYLLQARTARSGDG